MRIDHTELVHLVTQHYYVGSVEKLNDLPVKDQQQIAIAVLKDHSHFDGCEILQYHEDPARNMISVLEDHYNNKLNAQEVVDKIYTIILNAARKDIDQIFTEFADHAYWQSLYESGYAHKEFIKNLSDKMENL